MCLGRDRIGQTLRMQVPKVDEAYRGRIWMCLLAFRGCYEGFDGDGAPQGSLMGEKQKRWRVVVCDRMTTSIGEGHAFGKLPRCDRLQRDLATKAEKHVQLCRFATRPLLHLESKTSDLHGACSCDIILLYTECNRFTPIIRGRSTARWVAT